MNHDLLFSFFNSLALIGWSFLIFFPNLKITKLCIRSGYLSILFCLSYTIFCILALTSNAPGGFQKLDELLILFDNKSWVLTGWIHYLAFDLFIGTWILKDSIKHNIRHALIIPSLIFTFILGPFGFIIYFITRALHLKKILSLNE